MGRSLMCTSRIFSTDDISILDINELIDIGYRFDVSNDHFTMKVEDYLNGNKSEGKYVLPERSGGSV